jgi:hypothetical protein
MVEALILAVEERRQWMMVGTQGLSKPSHRRLEMHMTHEALVWLFVYYLWTRL